MSNTYFPSPLNGHWIKVAKICGSAEEANHAMEGDATVGVLYSEPGLVILAALDDLGVPDLPEGGVCYHP